MQRSGSATRIRQTRRRALGVTTAVAVHLLAVSAMAPVARWSALDRSQPSDVDAPLTIVQLVHLRPPAPEVPTAPSPPDSPKSKAASLPEPPAPFDLAQADPQAPGPSPPSRAEDDDPLYRVPFRDAVAQADARLRAGLGCAHVDLDELPKTVFDMCAAARGRNAAHPHGPLG
jgi:hypothetical protein